MNNMEGNMKLDSVIEGALISRFSNIRCRIAELDEMREKGTLNKEAYDISMQEVSHEVEELERYLSSFEVAENE